MTISNSKYQLGKINILFVAIAAIAIIIGIMAQKNGGNTSTEASKSGLSFNKLILLPNPIDMGEVNFTTHTGASFTNKNLLGKWSILFFAFTNCPDICPTTLQTMQQVKQEMTNNGTWPAFQLAMVSVDPERDTAERLQQYVPHFDKEFIGLTGKLDYTTQFAKNLGILFFKGETLPDGNYDVDHSSGLILVNPKGQYAGYLGAPHQKQILIEDLTKLGAQAMSAGHIINEPELNSSKAQDNTDQNSSVVTSANQSGQLQSNIIMIENAWIRPAPPSAPSMAGYFLINNTSESTINIVDAESPLFDMAMIHETVIEDGIASMQHMDGLVIKAGESAQLAPMGVHLMLMRPEQKISVGTKVPITLTLESGEELEIEIPVRNNPNE